ncbi:Benzoate 4-monooxygenase [Sparassis crispa]|uniref:Benzoate 4-monooxygenase n=1 Tax=Sparassis crispa TaxID=139825 RepID=A0A401GDQ0_9APHY|nr:Benzoate 4-monooxygenase [Sparassis crispa]GBE80243.1 Benzoate 4-monooxygenase [Sparassis crispa]
MFEVLLNLTAHPIPFVLCLLPVVVLAVHVVPYLVDEHGLRQYPGPFFARFSDGWLFWVSSKFRRTNTVDELHQKYGPFVRIAPNHISIVSPEAVSAVYGHSTGTTKSAFYDTFTSYRAIRGIFNARSRTEHARKRRVMAHMFSPQSVRAFEGPIKVHLQTLLNQWDIMCNSAVRKDEVKTGTLGSSTWEVRGGYVWFDAQFWCNLFTFDVIGELAFGSPFGMLLRGQDTARIRKSLTAGIASYALDESTAQEPAAQYEVEEIDAIDAVSARMEVSPILGVLPTYVREFVERMPQHRRGLKAQGQLIGLAAEAISRRLAAARQAEDEGKIFDDMFGKLLNGRDENGNPMTERELTTEAVTLLVAGSDTTSNSLATVIFHVARNQNVQKRLQAELDAVAGSDSSILPFVDVKSLPYLEAVINEGLRILTAVGFGLGRVVPEGGITVLGHTFSAGTEISVPLYSMHHSEEVWGADVEEYRPERWLDAEKRGELMKVFNPFSLGPRACIGRNVALQELTLVLAAVFRRYDIVLQPGREFGVHDNFVRKPHECVVGIKRREI